MMMPRHPLVGHPPDVNRPAPASWPPGVVADLAAHPLPRLLEEGLVVTLNSDDPPMFGTTLRDEYVAAARTLGLSPAGLADLARNAARAAFLPQAEAAALVAEIDTVPLPPPGP